MCYGQRKFGAIGEGLARLGTSTFTANIQWKVENSFRKTQRNT